MRLPALKACRRVHVGVAALYALVVVVFLVSVAQFQRPKTGLTYLIEFGDAYHLQKLPAVREVPHYTHAFSQGYDGQFYAQLAVEPLLRDRRIDEALDTPPYRARRILFSWTAYLLGMGRPEWILKAYAVQNVVAWLVLAGLLLVWLPPTSPRHLAAWAGALFGAGLIGSVRLALLDGPSLVLLVLAVLAIERGRAWTGAVVMALAGLGRETNLLGGSVLATRVPASLPAAAAAAAQAAIVVAPVVVWALYVRAVYAGYTYSNVDNFGVPFAGYLERWVHTLETLRAEGWDSLARYNLASLVALTTQAVFVVTRWQWGSPWWRLGAAYCVLLATLSLPVWEGYPGASMRVLLPLSFAFNVLVVQSRWCWPLVVLGNLSVWQGVKAIEVPFLSGSL